MKVSSAEFIKNFSALVERTLVDPVIITENGRDLLVVISTEEYARLKRRDRRVIRTGDLRREDIALIAETEVTGEFTHLDTEL